MNALLFQITWFACVIGSSQNILWPGILSCIALIVWQLSPKRRHPRDFTAIILGLIIDTVWLQLNFIKFTSPWPAQSIAPAWIIMLWVSLALTINHSLNWLRQHPLLPALMGLIGAPLSYTAGAKLGAISYQTDTLLVCSSLGIAWAIALPLLYLISTQKGHNKKTTARHIVSNPDTQLH